MKPVAPRQVNGRFWDQRHKPVAPRQVNGRFWDMQNALSETCTPWQVYGHFWDIGTTCP
jgi:hypothetical protein